MVGRAGIRGGSAPARIQPKQIFLRVDIDSHCGIFDRIFDHPSRSAQNLAGAAITFEGADCREKLAADEDGVAAPPGMHRHHCKRRGRRVEGFDQPVDQSGGDARHIGQQNERRGGALRHGGKPGPQRPRQAGIEIDGMNKPNIEAGERRCRLCGGMANDHQDGTRARSKCRFGDMPDERFSIELGNHLRPREPLSSPGRQDDRGDPARRGRGRPEIYTARSERSGFWRRAAMISARMEMAISAGLTAPISNPIGA